MVRMIPPADQAVNNMHYLFLRYAAKPDERSAYPEFLKIEMQIFLDKVAENDYHTETQLSAARNMIKEESFFDDMPDENIVDALTSAADSITQFTTSHRISRFYLKLIKSSTRLTLDSAGPILASAAHSMLDVFEEFFGRGSEYITDSTVSLILAMDHDPADNKVLREVVASEIRYRKHLDECHYNLDSDGPLRQHVRESIIELTQQECPEFEQFVIGTLVDAGVINHG